MKKIVPYPLLSFVLWIVWLLLNNTIAIGHVFLGAILAIIIPLAISRFWIGHQCVRNVKTIFKFAAVVFWDILVANIIVAKLILGKKDHLQPKFLHIPLDIKEPLAISILANTISLTPGTVSCDLSPNKKILLVHGLHEEDPEVTIMKIKQRYETPLKEIFESC
ncbi:MAG TPA: Na+/H+ antiporter subunit E [Campylobacterales bacterium]|nr:Na+/H+ antiporter subunit E [Campylobacterales bacterium]